jgi:hypothetical protein
MKRWWTRRLANLTAPDHMSEEGVVPLRDHFQPPLHPRRHWESFHANWATRIADDLNGRLPQGFFAEEFTHSGARLEIDVASYEETTAPVSPNGSGVATLTTRAIWSPPAPAWSVPAVFPDTFSVRVFQSEGGVNLIAAIELISPSNKDRPDERRAFAVKCANYLVQGVALIIIDIVTSRHANLHNETMTLIDAAPSVRFADEQRLYAVSYRPVLRGEKKDIDMWPANLAVGEPLPTMPLRLTGDMFVPVDFEAAYAEAYRHRRLP